MCSEHQQPPELIITANAAASEIYNTFQDEVAAIVLLGSVARGEATTASDIDLCIVAKSHHSADHPALWEGSTNLLREQGFQLGGSDGRISVCTMSLKQIHDYDKGIKYGAVKLIENLLKEGVVLAGSL